MHKDFFVTGLILIFLPFLLWLVIVALGIDLSNTPFSIIILPFIGVVMLIGFILFIAGLFTNPKVTLDTSKQISGE